MLRSLNIYKKKVALKFYIRNIKKKQQQQQQTNKHIKI